MDLQTMHICCRIFSLLVLYHSYHACILFGTPSPFMNAFYSCMEYDPICYHGNKGVMEHVASEIRKGNLAANNALSDSSQESNKIHWQLFSF